MTSSDVFSQKTTWHHGRWSGDHRRQGAGLGTWWVCSRRLCTVRSWGDVKRHATSPCFSNIRCLCLGGFYLLALLTSGPAMGQLHPSGGKSVVLNTWSQEQSSEMWQAGPATELKWETAQPQIKWTCSLGERETSIAVSCWDLGVTGLCSIYWTTLTDIGRIMRGREKGPRWPGQVWGCKLWQWWSQSLDNIQFISRDLLLSDFNRTDQL